jgi:uncharacterized protein YjbI with pentapeptide repeats
MMNPAGTAIPTGSGTQRMADSRQLKVLRRGVCAWNKWRSRYASADIDLTDANLCDVVPRRYKSWGVELAGANLAGARLDGAILRYAHLSDADLSRARLDGADLTQADLSGAILTDSRLHNARLQGTLLEGARFEGTRFGNTVLNALDLRSVIGLKDVQHDGPSSIGVDTLACSQGTIYPGFLRGCGLRDWEIELAAVFSDSLPASGVTDALYRVVSLRASMSVLYADCFISYSHADGEFAAALHQELQERGIRCWLDKKESVPGDSIGDQMDRAIRKSDKVLLCCSRTSLESWWVGAEIETAFEKERRARESGSKTSVLIPLDLDGYLGSEQYLGDVATQLKARAAADFVGWKTSTAAPRALFAGEYKDELERVIHALEARDES